MSRFRKAAADVAVLSAAVGLNVPAAAATLANASSATATRSSTWW